MIDKVKSQISQTGKTASHEGIFQGHNDNIVYRAEQFVRWRFP